MSHFSDIGFPIANDTEFKLLIDSIIKNGQEINSTSGTYIHYLDISGAELVCQIDKASKMIGITPRFNGKSRRRVGLTNIIVSNSNKLSGGIYAWADPDDANDPESGTYPFAFDIPDFKTINELTLPQTATIQLSAFASNSYFKIFDNDITYSQSQQGEIKYATHSFIPFGLFSTQETIEEQAYGKFTGTIKEWELKINSKTNEKYYWLLVDTLGGEVDILADFKLIDRNPQINGIVEGEFWLSGRILSDSD
jgi:hypothetical protein